MSRYVVYRYLGIFDVLPAPLCPVRARPALSSARPPRFVLCARVPRAVLPLNVLRASTMSCAREFRERSSLLLLWARGIGGLAARTLVPLVFFFASRPANTRRPARYASNAGVSLCRI